MKIQVHEDYGRRIEERGASDRNFGAVFTLFFAAIGLWPLLRGGAIRYWMVAAGGVILAITLVRPALLHPLNHLWGRIGALLGRVVNPIVTGFLFYAAFTPIGFLLRLAGKDPLHLRFDPSLPSYWITRNRGEEPPDSMRDQF